MIVESNGLSKRYGSLVAVSGLDLRVPERSIYGFLGPNGAGKTTTIRMLLGLVSPSEGQITIFGQDLQRAKRQILARVGSLVETPSLYPNLTGRENLQVVATLLGLAPGRIDDALKLVDLADAQHRLVREYSLGMKQRLGIALALVHQPEVLILDEPTNGLDPQGLREMRDFLRTLPERLGVTVFLSSHLLAEVEHIATHLGILKQGQLLFQGSLATLRDRGMSTLALRVGQPDQARAVLRDRLVATSAPQPGDATVIVRVSSEQESAAITRQLVAAAVDVYAVVPQTSHLEDLFLELTGKAG
jgi:ABC-2 type transport system ATP-binding protein